LSSDFANSDIVIDWNLLSRFHDIVDLSEYSGTFLLIDSNVAGLYEQKIERIFGHIIADSKSSTLDTVETEDKLAVIERIAEKMVSVGSDRNSVLIAIGGDSIINPGAIAGSLYLGGIDFILIPTTLVSQAYGAIGNDWGIGIGGTANALGIYSPPARVLVDLSFLDTLSRSQINDGMAELVQIALIADSGLFDKLESIGYSFMGVDDKIKHEIISRAIGIRLALQSRQKSKTKAVLYLNSWHVLSQSLRDMVGKSAIARGQSMALAIMIIAEVSEKRIHLKAGDKSRIIDCAKVLLGGFDKPLPDLRDLWIRFGKMNKFYSGQSRLILVDSIGSAKFGDIEPADFRAACESVENEILKITI